MPHLITPVLCLVLVASLALAAEHDSSGILPKDASVEKVAGGFRFTEGPVWSPEGYLLFSDVPSNNIVRFTVDGKIGIYRHPSGFSNGLTFDRQGRLIACECIRRVSRTEKDGTIAALADRYEGKRLNSPNDIVVRSDGSIYFTDPPYGLSPQYQPDNKPGVRELDFQGIYRISPKGELALLDKLMYRPNGLAFSPDEKLLYVADSERNLIRVFDVRKDGSLANGRLFATLKEEGQRGGPDGMKVDVKGNIYCTGPGGVWVFSPDATVVAKIRTPEVAANVAFGGKDYKTLYITAQTGLYKIPVKIKGIKVGPR
ncbi:MAG TPA: SMP-30/gluconolactonase/LRE family protein [Armatimonadota bacterium]|nr:SMP-30/gluconolactonase/LRE family protein [Armatimonadota bacterium]